MVLVRSLADVQALEASRLNTAALNQICRELGSECAIVLTFEIGRSEATVHVRMFAPLLGGAGELGHRQRQRHAGSNPGPPPNGGWD